MLQSMTGFGKSEVSIGGMRYTIDIKSLNSKNIDLNVRLPYWMRAHELEIRKMISDGLQRGKIDVYINHEVFENSSSVSLNKSLIKAYMAQMDEISPGLPVQSRFQAAMQLPDVMQSDQNDFTDEEWTEFRKALLMAIESTVAFRNDEGKVLEEEFRMRIQNIEDAAAKVPAYEAERIQRLKDRIHKSLDDLQEVDKDRLEQELIFYLEKLDITEEKLRLKNHLDYFIQTMNSGDSNGKKLNFITQEIGREINTLGSKSNHAEMQKLVVEMKDELEKIKEQMLNVL